MSTASGLLRALAITLSAHAEELNVLDGKAGDGDLGVTATKAAAALLARGDVLSSLALPDLLKVCGRVVADEAPSTAGTLLAIGLLAASEQVGADMADGRRCAAVLTACGRAIAEAGGASVGAKTLLDALIPSAQAAERVADEGGQLADVLFAAASAADRGAQSTVGMTPFFGRASWLKGRAVGVEDAGARLVAIALDALAEAAGDPT